jgi:thiamine transport system permease protein
MLVAGLCPHPGLDRFLVGYAAPSTVLTGFAFLLLGIESWLGVHLSLICGLAILMVPSLYRMLARGLLSALQNQVIVARIGGAGWWRIFDKIVFPQVRWQFWWLAGMGSLWACGDYALSSLVVENNTTLALAIKGYMTSYHLDLATALNSLLLVVGMSCLLGFGGLGRVCRTKSLS